MAVQKSIDLIDRSNTPADVDTLPMHLGSYPLCARDHLTQTLAHCALFKMPRSGSLDHFHAALLECLQAGGEALAIASGQSILQVVIYAGCHGDVVDHLLQDGQIAP